MGCWLQRVMTTALHQASANESKIGDPVQQHQFAHRIANHHLRAARGDFAAAAQGEAETAFLHHLAGIFKTLRMARNQNQK